MIDTDRPFLEQARKLYDETGNPLYAWQAYNFARQFAISIPEWVAEYLDRAAVNLMFLDRGKGRIRDLLGPALELGKGGGGGAWSRQFTTALRKAAVQDYERAKAADPDRSDFDIFSELSDQYKLRSTDDGKPGDSPIDHARIANWVYGSRKKLDQ